MALIGIVLASLVNFYGTKIEALMWAVTYIGVVVFVEGSDRLPDTQKLKNIGEQIDTRDSVICVNIRFSALTLAADFINCS